jgi:hypothetical protein
VNQIVQWGRPEAISDITEAAGWVILDCDSNRMEQDIRLACMSSIQDEVGCSNLFQSIPPTGKIVRLPESVRYSSVQSAMLF